MLSVTFTRKRTRGAIAAASAASIPTAFIATLAALPGLVAISASPGRCMTSDCTFSIVARDSVTGEVGVAVQSRAFNVGQAVPWAEAGVGAVATQASTNESFGPRALDLLRAGVPAEVALGFLLQADEDREHRQLAIVDAQGHAANWTGSGCMSWAGGVAKPGLAVQGNILAGEAVVTAMVRAYESAEGPLAERLLAALDAAQTAGGDRRGQQSAALLVVRESKQHPEFRTRFVDLRVDDHPEPIREIRRLYELSIPIDMVEAYLALADEHEKMGRTELAAADREYVQRILRRANTDDPSGFGADALNALAWAAATRDLFLDDALAAAERAARLEPRSAEILDTLAEIHWRRGAFAEAVKVGESALSLSPDDGYLHNQLDKYRLSLAQGKRSE